MYKVVVALLALVASVYAHEVRIINGCPFTVWIGVVNNPGKELPANGGFQLNTWGVRSLYVPNGWAGRVWARTNCDGSGHCETGNDLNAFFIQSFRLVQLK